LAKENKIAIFISTYNQGQFLLPNCLWFIAQQTYKDFICVVGDDQSSDNTKEVVENICKQDKRFIYHLTPKKYFRNALFYNWAAKEYKTKYIITCDGDNYLYEDCVAARLEAIEIGGDVAVYSYSDVLFWDEKREKIISQYVRGRQWNLNDYVYYTSFNNYIDMCDIIFDRKAYLDVGGYFESGIGFQDYSIMIRLAMKYSNRIGCLPKILTQYNSFTDGQCRAVDSSEEAHKNCFSDDPKDWQL